VVLYRLMIMNPYVLSIFAAFLVGFHIFSIKYLRVTRVSTFLFYVLAIASFGIFIASRYFAFVASSALPITVIHLILNLSIIISTALSILVYKTEIIWSYFLLGVVLMMIGVCFIELSIKYHYGKDIKN